MYFTSLISNSNIAFYFTCQQECNLCAQNEELQPPVCDRVAGAVTKVSFVDTSRDTKRHSAVIGNHASYS